MRIICKNCAGLFVTDSIVHTFAKKIDIMKKVLSIVVIAMIGLFVFTGCTKKSSSSPSYTMKATVGSTAFSVTNCLANINSTLLSVYGYGGSGTTATFPNITLQMSNYTTTGTFTIDTTAVFPSLTLEYFPTSALTDVKMAKNRHFDNIICDFDGYFRYFFICLH